MSAHLLVIYTYVLFDGAGSFLSTSADTFKSDVEAEQTADTALFANPKAAGYELWHNSRRIRRLMRPALG